MSWNEQGEILQKEGMLTICFSYISSCSHRDSWKQLYLIIKIPYLVNMPWDYELLLKIKDSKKRLNFYDEAVPSLIKELEKEKSQRIMLENKIKTIESNLQKANLENKDNDSKISVTPVNLDDYAKWLEEVPKLKQRIKDLKATVDELTPEIENLTKENLRLKIISGEAKSGWKQDQDMIERDNPETGKLEQYKCPINFRHEEVNSLKYLDGHRLMVRFYHHDSIENHSEYYEMPTDAYKWLKNELPEQKNDKAKKTKILKIGSGEQMIQHLDSCKIDYHGLDYLDIAIDFILSNKGKKFETRDFRRETKMQSGTTIQNYLRMFEKAKVLFKIKTGLWEVIIQ